MTVSGTVESPYRGLNAFDERDAVFFFGREAATAAVLERMSAQLHASGPLVVSGVSGAGKSSLLQAGVLPLLRGKGLRAVQEAAVWPCLMFTPGSAPLDELAVAVASLAGSDAAELRRGLGSDPGSFRLTARQAAASRRGDGSQPRLVLVIDQFEQLFTQCQDEVEREAFLTAIDSATAAVNGHAAAALVILSVRADFEARCAEYPTLKESIQNRYLVTSMTDRQLELAVTEPPKKLDAHVDNELVEALLREMKGRKTAIRAASSPTSGGVFGAGVLPLLSHSLDQAWRTRVDPKNLTLADYERAGGIEGAVRTSAGSAYAKLTPSQQPMARQVFIRLTTTTADGVDAADRVNRDDLIRDVVGAPAKDVEAVLEGFAAERLVTLGSRTVEIAHEVLLTAWPLLRDWLVETHADRVVRSRIHHAATEWLGHNHDPSYLYRGTPLDLATETVDRLGADPARYPPLSEIDRDFLNAGLRARRRESQRRHAFTGALMGLVLATGLVAVLAIRASQTASQQRDIAVSQQLIREGEDLGGADPANARLKSLAAWRIHPSDGARYAMIAAASLPGIAVMTGHTGSVFSAAFSPDGKTLASGAYDKWLRVWDVAGRQPVSSLLTGPQTGAVLSVAFSPDGETLASGGWDRTVRLWDVASHRPIGSPLTGHVGAIESVAFSPDGNTLASGGRDSTVRLWDVASHRPIGSPLTGHVGAIESVAFSPDGKTLASGGWDDTIRMWDVASHRPIGSPLTGHGDYVESVTFSPDGKTLASGGWDDTIRMWDVASHRPIGSRLTGHTGGVWSVAFSPDGKTLASGGRESTILLWDVASHRRIGSPLTGHVGPIFAVAFSPDGETLASGGWDSTVRLWDVASHRPTGSPLTGHTGDVEAVAFSPDGETLASGGWDSTVRLWDVAGHRPIGSPIKSHRGPVESVAFSPDGETLASGGRDSTVRLWDVASHRPTGSPITGHTGGVSSVAFSPDGKTLASGGRDSTVRLWDVASHRRIGSPLTGHGGPVNSVAFSPDGKTLASGSSDNTTRLWDVASHRPTGSPLTPNHAGSVESVTFSPDGKTLASGSVDQSVRLWDMASQRLVGSPLVGHTGQVESVAFSPDGKTLASGGRDSTVRLWDVPSQRPIGSPLTGHVGPVNSVAFGPDGSTFASARYDTVQVWNLPHLADPASFLCKSVGQSFTSDQWHSLVPEGPRYRPLCP
ncbi:WD40 repeat domain-containing protein [Streptomyces sp. SID13031]|uniref:WD40 repeat domain-containing protein n=1 Tax=Streptomyces sp. SID13031 TaxID=2706046 RepID=UPI0031BB64EB